MKMKIHKDHLGANEVIIKWIVYADNMLPVQGTYFLPSLFRK